MAKSEALLSGVLAISPDAVMVFQAIRNGDGIIEDFECQLTNPAAERLLHLSNVELVGKRVLKVMPADHNYTFFGSYVRVVETGAVLNQEVPLERGGQTLWFRTVAAKLDDGFAVTFSDITQRKRDEDAQRFLAEASRILSSSLDYGTLLPMLAKASVPTLGSICVIELVGEAGLEYLAISHVDPEKEKLLRQASSLYPADEMRSNLARQVVASGSSMLFSEITEVMLASADRDGDYLGILQNVGLKSVMAVPMTARSRTLGVLIFVVTESERRYGAEDLALAEELAQLAAFAVDNARLFADEQSSAHKLRTLSRKLLETHESERRSIARELHDEIGQSLTALKLVLGTSLRTVGPADSSLRDAQSIVDELLDRVRNMSLYLRPMVLDDLGLLPALLWFLGRYRARTGVQVVFKHDGVEGQRWAAEIETAAYRIVQESLTNVARHAGVDRAEIRVWANPESLGLQVGDSGAGFDLERVLSSGESTGLFGMRERVNLLGGSLTMEASPGGGSRLTALLPLRAQTSEERG